MTRLVVLAMAVLLGGCATHRPPPLDEPACAIAEEDVDGGIGGTGKRPDGCPSI